MMVVASSTVPFWLCFGISVAFWHSTSVAVAAAPTQQQQRQPQDTCTPSTPTVAVAVQRSASADEHSYVIAHAGCFGTSKSGGAADGGECVDSAAAAAAAVCCNAMERAVRFLCLHAPTNTSTSTGKGRDDSSSFLLANHSICRGFGSGSEETAASWKHSCAEIIASVPSYTYEAEDEVLVATHMLSIWDQEIEMAAASTTEGDSSNPDAKYTSFGMIGKQYVWDEMGGGRWHSESSSPFLVAGLGDREEDTISSHAQSSVPATIISSVSESGGMHRTHSHKVVLSLGQIIDNGASEARGEVTVLLPLGQGLFMDMDDALQNDGDCTVASVDGQCRAEMIPLPYGVVVDIEQPSFASRQHVLAIQVSFQLQNLDQQDHSLPDVALDFASNLHLRYQAPLIGGEEGVERGARIIPVHVPSTFVGGGHVEGGSHSFSIYGGQVQSEAIVVEAATGHDCDYSFVVVATLLASVIGSLAMIRDFSRVSRWV